MQDYRRIHRALVSVYYKDGIDKLAQAFLAAGTHVVSTGSTAQHLRQLGVDVTDVSQITGFPESFDGRVKTLDPHVHAGILADTTNEDHVKQLNELHLETFDLVVVNLYPFAQTVLSGANQTQSIEKIDIGGPSMVRGAAKNSLNVTVITDPADYKLTAKRIANEQGFALEERRALAAKAFEHTAAYDAAIAQWMRDEFGDNPRILASDNTTSADESGTPDATDSTNTNASSDNAHDTTSASIQFPQELSYSFKLSNTLRYGENPHQEAALYTDFLGDSGIAHAVQLGGKQMSYNNYVDADAAWNAVWDFAPSIAVAVVKHNNPCGIAIGSTVQEAHRKAHACDPVSAYGGVIAVNAPVNLELAEQIRPIFTEVIIAPAFAPDALQLLTTKKKNLRILQVPTQPSDTTQFRRISGGLLVQRIDRIDTPGDNSNNWQLVAGQAADDTTLADLLFAWKAIRCVKSNAILLANDQAAVGIGMGQVNRVDSCQLSIERANTLAGELERARGAVAASDAFFPFADGPQHLINAGVRAIVQPGGSIRDEEVFEAARKANITMYVTGTRHFFH